MEFKLLTSTSFDGLRPRLRLVGQSRWQRKGFSEHRIPCETYEHAKALIDGIPEPEDLAYAVVEGRYVCEWGEWNQHMEREAPQPSNFSKWVTDGK